MTNRRALSRRPAVRALLAALVAMAVAILGLPAAASADTIGTAVLKVGSQITVTSSANPTPPNADVTLTATFAVVDGNSDVSPTGDVTFLDDGVALGTGTLAGQSASWTGQLPLGNHPITASYDGDSNYTAGVSEPLPLSVAVVPVLAISVAGGSPTMQNDGSWSSSIYLAAKSDATDNDYPHTLFGLSFSGISGLTAADLGLQEDTGSGWTDVPVTGQSGNIAASVGVDSDLSPGGSTGVTVRMKVIEGAPAGTLSLGASLLSSPDGTSWNSILATASQAFTVQPANTLTPTTTTVTASNVVTDTKSAPVTITAGVTPSAATGTVTFMDNGNPVGAAALSNGKATVTPSLGLGYHSISASYSGDSNYATSTGTQEQQVSVSPPGGSLHAITPVRMLDTRPGRTAVFTPGTKIAAGKSMNLQITGQGGIPATGVAGISVNITVVQPAATGYVTIYPTGGAVPGTANIDFPQGANTAGLVITDVSASGQITILNKSNGPIDAIADVSAWFAQQTSSFDGQGRYNAVVPFRLLDTRKTLRMRANTMVSIPVAGVGSIPKTGVEAVMLNVTSVNPSAAAYLVLYPGGAARPLVSTTAFQKAETRAGRVIVGVGSDGTVDLYNSPYASTDVVVDIAGWFTGPASTAGGATFVPLTVSQRLTPAQTGGSLWGSGTFRAVQIAGVDGIPKQSSAIHASAVVGNLHVSAPTTGGYLTAYPLALRPTTSDLNFVKGAALQNLSIATLGSSGAFNLYNYNGSATVIIDIYGWFG